MNGNRYFVVDSRAVMQTLPIKVGTRPSNRWYGASQVHENVTEQWRVEPGAEVHVLVGGAFVVDYYVNDARPTAHEIVFPGERNPYSGDDSSKRALEQWLSEYATELDSDGGRFVVEKYR